LIDVQDNLASAPTGQFYSVTPIDLLRLAVKSILDDYDVVLIDCPPNLGIITLNGLRISEGYIITTVPDVLSTYGIPQIIKRVSNFSKEIAENIKPLGIVITKFQENSTVHINVSKDLRRQDDPPVFETVIRQANQIAAAAELQSSRRTLKQKYGYGDLATRYIELARELLQKLEIDA
jgi:chromosome partitioning protein